MSTVEASAVDLRLIPEFNGEGDFLEWMEKLELVCELRGVTKLEQVIPLRLTGGAFAVYQQIPKANKKDAAKVKEALTISFGQDRFIAYEQFVTRRLQPGESVDVLLADLRKLANAFGGVPDGALGCAFVAALPDNVRQLLRAGSRMESAGLNEILSMARAIMVNEGAVSCAVRFRDQPAPASNRPSDTSATRRNVPARRCFRCRGPHLVQECKSPLICWTCGDQGLLELGSA